MPSVPVDGGHFCFRGEAVIDQGDQWAMVGRMLLAAALGAAAGLEREFRGYPAGVRTMALVCMGAALFADVSSEFGGNDRVAAQIVTGIGFLGAGLIFREGEGIRGVTTAATIWVVAAVGMAVAAELYVVAIVVTALIVGLLELRLVTKEVTVQDFEDSPVAGGSGEVSDE